MSSVQCRVFRGTFSQSGDPQPRRPRPGSPWSPRGRLRHDDGDNARTCVVLNLLSYLLHVCSSFQNSEVQFVTCSYLGAKRSSARHALSKNLASIASLRPSTAACARLRQLAICCHPHNHPPSPFHRRRPLFPSSTKMNNSGPYHAATLRPSDAAAVAPTRSFSGTNIFSFKINVSIFSVRLEEFALARSLVVAQHWHASAHPRLLRRLLSSQ